MSARSPGSATPLQHPLCLISGFHVSDNDIWMDPDNVCAVASWPTPTSHKLVQLFFGFTNSYRRFIQNFGTVAASLYALTSAHVKFMWSPQAEQAFRKLKQSFTSAPIHTLPDPSQYFILEWMPRTWASGPSSFNGLRKITNSTPAPSCHTNCPLWKGTMMWGTGSYW